MTRVRIEAFTISADGYGAGPDQTLATPMGEGAEELHRWMIGTRTFRALTGREGGTEGLDDRVAAQSFEGIGAWVMGRHMFTHERGPWHDPDWRGWWGEVPPYHCDVFVLTHHRRESLPHGGTTFHFVTEGLEAALDRARASAGGRDIRLGGGVSTVRQAFAAGLVDQANIAVSPILLGRGEALFPGLDLPALGYRITRRESTEFATHLTIGREAD